MSMLNTGLTNNTTTLPQHVINTILGTPTITGSQWVQTPTLPAVPIRQHPSEHEGITPVASKKEFAKLDRDKVPHYILATDGHSLLFGPPGTGKTFLATTSVRRGQTMTEVTFRGEQSDYAIWGQDVPVTDDHGNPTLVWRAGPALVAARDGHWLVMNEINKASQDISDRLHMLLDHFSVAQDTLPDGTIIRVHPEFRCIATMNGIPEELAEPVRDRFKIVIPVTVPSNVMLARLDPDVREVCFAGYDKCADPVVGPDITYRNALAFCDVRRQIGNDELAALLVMGNRDKAVTFSETVRMLKQKLDQEKNRIVQSLFTALMDASQMAMTGSIVDQLFASIADKARADFRKLSEEFLKS